MELLQLRYFIAAAKFENISKAANFYNIPQPAMSQTISRLEHELGDIRLFDRKSNKLYLNDHGRLFLSYVEEALLNLDNGVLALKSQNAEVTGAIHILIMENRRFVLNCISRFSERYPNVTFFISHDYYSDQNTLYDLCVSSMQAYQKMSASIPLIEEEIVLAVHESNPLSKREWVSLSELKNENFITMPPRSSLYKITFEQCRASGFEPHIHFTCDDPYFVRKYISENMGIALAPSVSWAERFRSNTVVVPIKNPSIISTSYLLWDERKYLTPAVRIFHDYLIEEARHVKGNLLQDEV